MRLLIDADGCPVVDASIILAKQHAFEPILLCDSAHVFHKEGVQVITVSTGADSVDFALVNLVEKGDVVVTQDYGLAAMCLARGAAVLNQNGLVYTQENIQSLLESRHTAKKARRAGQHTKGPAKRTAQQDADFRQALSALLAAGTP